jgi:hypothetical protein
VGTGTRVVAGTGGVGAEAAVAVGGGGWLSRSLTHFLLVCSSAFRSLHNSCWCLLLSYIFSVGFFFRKGAAPASASIDAYGHFYYFIKEFYNVIQIMDHKGSPQKSARQK